MTEEIELIRGSGNVYRIWNGQTPTFARRKPFLPPISSVFWTNGLVHTQG
jgi:hypothetical protein